jgi:hypothetical protein
MTAQGTISGSTISGSEIRGSTFYNTSKTGWIIINQDATNYADFTFGVDTSTLPLLKLYNNTTSCNWLTLNHEFLRTTSSQALPQGSWNFSNSTVTGLIGYATSSDITTLYNYINMNFQPKA